MALFGAPVAHEDDAERAVRAGARHAAGDGRDQRALPGGVTFALRVGVNTGEVLAGAVGDSYTVIGDTVNVASRLQTAAPAGQRHGRRAHRCAPRARRPATTSWSRSTLKGKSEPVPAWEAAG